MLDQSIPISVKSVIDGNQFEAVGKRPLIIARNADMAKWDFEKLASSSSIVLDEFTL